MDKKTIQRIIEYYQPKITSSCYLRMKMPKSNHPDPHRYIPLTPEAEWLDAVYTLTFDQQDKSQFVKATPRQIAENCCPEEWEQAKKALYPSAELVEYLESVRREIGHQGKTVSDVPCNGELVANYRYRGTRFEVYRTGDGWAVQQTFNFRPDGITYFINRFDRQPDASILDVLIDLETLQESMIGQWDTAEFVCRKCGKKTAIWLLSGSLSDRLDAFDSELCSECWEAEGRPGKIGFKVVLMP